MEWIASFGLEHSYQGLTLDSDSDSERFFVVVVCSRSRFGQSDFSVSLTDSSAEMTYIGSVGLCMRDSCNCRMVWFLSTRIALACLCTGAGAGEGDGGEGGA